MLEWRGVVRRVERRRVVLGAELLGEVELPHAAVLLAHVPVEAEVVEEVVALELGVVLDHPVQLGCDERLDDRRGDVRVVERAECVADVVEQCAQDVAVVPSGSLRARRSLQGVGEPIDREAAEVAVEQPEVVEYPAGQVSHVVRLVAGDDLPVLLGALCHVREGRAVTHLCH